MAWQGAGVVLLLVLAGCGDPGARPGPGEFDGAGAYAYVEGLVTQDGEPRFRVPGTEGHAAGAEWLAATAAMPGWSVRRESFPGSDYFLLDMEPVAAWVGGRCDGAPRAHVESLTFTNIVATWRAGDGAEDGAERDAAMDHVLLGAHWDSKAEASSGRPVLGANDGASGVGVLLQLMEHIARGDVEPGLGRLDVVFFDGEDGFDDCHPLAGSLYHAQMLAPGELPDAMLLLDMVGDPGARFPRESASLAAAPELVAYLWSMQERFGLERNMVDDERRIVDDHVPFIHEGVAAVDIVDAARLDGRGGFPPYWHTDDDTMENLDEGMLGRVGGLVAAFVVDPRPAPNPETTTSQ